MTGLRYTATLIALLTACACSPNTGADICPRPRTAEPVDFRGGTNEDGIYMTSSWDGELLHYPAGAYYRIHHDLGVVPRDLSFWISFSRYGNREGDSVSEAAGNIAEVKEVTEESVTVLNGTCAEYWMLAVIE